MGMRLAAVLLAAGIAAVAQQSPIPPSTGLPPTRVPAPTLSQPDRQLERRPAGQTEAVRSIFISGRIQVADGSALPKDVRIHVSCATGQSTGIDSKGEFRLTIDSIARMGEASLIGCDLRAVAAGFRSDVIPLAGHTTMDNGNVGAVLLHRAGPSEGLTYSATSMLAPKDAKEAFDRGAKAAAKNKADEAESAYKKAVELYPRYAAAWQALGMLFESRARYEEARTAFLQSIQCDSKYLDPYERLARLSFKEQKWDEAIRYSASVERLNPETGPDLYLLSGIAYLKLNQLDMAEEQTRTAIRAGAQHASGAYYILAAIQLKKQDLSGAAGSLRHYLDAAPDAPNAPQAKAQLAEIDRRLASQQ